MACVTGHDGLMPSAYPMGDHEHLPARGKVCFAHTHCFVSHYSAGYEPSVRAVLPQLIHGALMVTLSAIILGNLNLLA